MEHKTFIEFVEGATKVGEIYIYEDKIQIEPGPEEYSVYDPMDKLDAGFHSNKLECEYQAYVIYLRNRRV